MRQSLTWRANRSARRCANGLAHAGVLRDRPPLVIFKTSLRLALWSKPQVNAILLPYRTVLYSA